MPGHPPSIGHLKGLVAAGRLCRPEAVLLGGGTYRLRHVRPSSRLALAILPPSAIAPRALGDADPPSRAPVAGSFGRAAETAASYGASVSCRRCVDPLP